MRYGLYQTRNRIQSVGGLSLAFFCPFSRAGTRYLARAFSSSQVSAFSASLMDALAEEFAESLLARVGTLRELEKMTPVGEM